MLVLVESMNENATILFVAFCFPPSLCGFAGAFLALLRAKRSHPSRATLKATPAAQDDCCGVFTVVLAG
jgi:hypothetical protein